MLFQEICWRGISLFGGRFPYFMPCPRLFAERYAIDAAAEPAAMISANGDAPTMAEEDLSALAVFTSSEPPAIVTA